jgi:hypothetical protein
MSKYFEFKKGREFDWLELNLLRTGEGMSKSLISSLADGVSEEDIDSWIRELEFRNTLYTNPYFKVEHNKITPLLIWSDIPEYYLCVYYSYFGAGDASIGTKLFEKISAQSLKNFIEGEVYSLGFPEGKGLNAYLDEFINCCYETRGIKANSDYKDDGVDVIGFKLFQDNRSANLYILLQCAAGIHWRTKKKIELNRWTKYIFWYPECIISSIATVDYVSQKDWEKQNSSFGMLIDRVRIYNTLYQKDIEQNLRYEVLAWANPTI